MSNTKKEFTTPVGRIVAGDLYKVNTTDAEGRPLLVKNGPNAGQPRSEVYFAIAIPKGQEQHWAYTTWGQVIYQVGAACFPGGQYNAPTFSWKVTDGDSQVPNSKNIKPCDREGWKGHWVIHFSSGFKPKIVNGDGTQEITQENAVKPGYWVQVFGYADGNGSTQRPGVFINHQAVALAGYDKEIQTSGVNTAAVGFGQGVALPAGVSATPIGGMMAGPGSMQGAPGVPGGLAMPGQPAGLPGVPAGLPGGLPAQPMMQPQMNPAAMSPMQPQGMPQMPGQPMMQPQMAAPGMLPAQPMQPAAQMPVMPNPGMTQMALGQPAAPMARPPQQRMTAAAQASYEQYIASGWSEAQMIQHGVMTAQ